MNFLFQVSFFNDPMFTILRYNVDIDYEKNGTKSESDKKNMTQSCAGTAGKFICSFKQEISNI